MRIAAFQPDIPQNLGALMRLSVCFGAPLHVIEPCGFPYSDKSVRKAAMDYAPNVELQSHTDWRAFLEERPPGRLLLASTKARTDIWSITFEANDFLLLGRESAGAPKEVRDAADEVFRIPMPGGGRSLNVAIAAGIVLAEAQRQGR